MNTRKRALSIFLALMMVLSLLPVSALAGDVQLEGLGVEDLDVSYTEKKGNILGVEAGSTSCTVNGLDGLNASATGAQKTVSLPFFGEKTFTISNQITVDLKNLKSQTARLSFSYTATPGSGSITINGTSVSGNGTFSELVQSGKVVSVAVVSNNGAGTSTIKISGITLLVEVNATTTFEPAAHGSYTVDGSEITETTSRTQLSTVAYAVKATPSSGYKFVCWYDPVAKQVISYAQNTSLYFDSDHTVTAIFEPTSTPVYEVDGALFTDLNPAISYAQTNNKSVIVLIGNGTLPAGNYTIPSGKTLLIPFDDSHSLFTNEPELTGSHTNPSAYRTLTMANGAKITVASGGAISVSSRLSATGTGSGSWNATPTAKHGRIAMNAGSSIDVQSGGKLYVYGYISGSGSVTAHSGSEVWEAFQLRCWRGGTAATDNTFENYKVFPMNQYYVQNIEAPLTLEAGATEMVYAAVNAGGKPFGASATFIGNGGMFKLSSGSITKQYIGSTDRLRIDVNGDLTLSTMQLSIKDLPVIGSLDIDTKDYVLPITNNISIQVNSGTTTVSSAQSVAFLPGSELGVANGATVDIQSGSKVYVYDQEQWGPYAGTNLNLIPVGYSTVNGTTTKRTAASLVDAIIDINGTVNVSGEIYTTTDGAAIISSEKTGVLNLLNKAGTDTKTYQAEQGGTEGKEVFKVEIPITAAQLKNGDSSYYPTAGKTAGTEIPYSKSLDVWGMKDSDPVVVHFDANGGEGDAVTIEAVAGETVSLANPGFTKDGYSFVGWYMMEPDNEQFFLPADTVTELAASELMELGEVTFYAKWEPIPVTNYTITWAVDGQEDVTTTVEAGEMPAYPNGTPAKAETAEYTYTFTGWSPEIAAASADVTYTAQFEATKRSYTVRWLNEDSSLIDETTVEYGTVPAHAAPEKASTDAFTYSFAGWKGSDDTVYPSDLPAVTGDVEYRAVFNETTNTYTIRFLDEEGVVLQSIEVAYGAQPVYTGETPDKADTAQYDYSFAGWKDASGVIHSAGDLPAVTGSADYTAAFSEMLNRYTVRFLWEGGVVSETDYDYGETINVPEAPQKDDTDQYTYEFAGWADENGEIVKTFQTVTGDAVYTATYNGTLRSYTVTFDVEGEQTRFENKDYGTLISEFQPQDPVKTDPDGIKVYTFAGWQLKDSDQMLSDTSVVTGEAIYVALFEETDREYTFTWYDEDGKTVLYGPVTGSFDSNPEYQGETPKKDQDAQYSYTFREWDVLIDKDAATYTYTAQYDAAVRSYVITFKNGDEVLQADAFEYGSMPVYGGATPQKADDAQYSYTFKGWSPEITEVTGEATYVAEFEHALKSYTVTWSIDGALEEETYQYGATPNHSNPTKEADAQYTYTFTGWTPEIGEVTGDVTYVAQFSKTVNTYVITWNVDDIQTTVVYAYGDTPVYPNGTPAKADTLFKTYTFTGWSPAAAEVTGDAEYTAQFEAADRIGWVTWEGAEYYITAPGELAKGVSEAEKDGEAGLYVFDPETGVFQSQMNGVNELEGDIYLVENGKISEIEGLYQTEGKEYYYFDENHKALRGDRIWIEKMNDLALPVWAYTFLDNGVIEHMDVNAQGIQTWEDGTLVYVIDGVRVHKGLFVQDGNYYYAKSSGALAVNEDYYVSGVTGQGFKAPDGSEMKNGVYTFDKQGRIVFNTAAPLNGIVKETADTWYYYVDGVKTYAGLIVIDGDLYYVKTGGIVVHDCTYWISKNNGLVEKNGSYTFDSEGKMVIEKPLNGIVKETADTWYYYVDGVKTYAGLIKIDGDLYYVKTGGIVVHDCTYWISKNNGLVERNGNYTFDAEGKMVTTPAPTPEPLNGIVKEADGTWYYYVDGVKTYAGLIKIDGYLYYVKTGGIVVHDCTYWISKNNGLVERNGNYTFDSEGHMILG